MFSKAIVRKPGTTFAQGISCAALGDPDLDVALTQHQRYREALQACGLSLTVLEADDQFPDSTFVEDTAILTPYFAVITRPGATSRQGEVSAMAEVLADHIHTLYAITAPGTVDGGDICQVGHHFFIGISERTTEAGAKQLAEFLRLAGYSSSVIDIRPVAGLLHLKTGLSYLEHQTVVVTRAMLGCHQFAGFQVICVPEDEEYAANCVYVNGRVLIPAGYPKVAAQLTEAGYQIVPLDMSEFQKMDGGLSCLSLRF
jgi:dimethylargininase